MKNSSNGRGKGRAGKPARTKADRSYSTRDTSKRKKEFKGAKGMISKMPIERNQRNAARRSPQANRRWKGEKYVR